MSKDKSRRGLNRRGFLKGLATAGGTAAASGLVSHPANAAVTAEPSEGTDSQQKKGYRITPHILEYYEKARF